MKKLPLLVICVIAFISVNVSSVYAADIKIGIIDTQKIIVQSQKIMKYRSDFSKDLEAKKQEFMKNQNSAQMLENELMTKQNEMTSEERKEKTRKLQRDARNLKRMQEELQAELKSKDSELGRMYLMQIRDVAIEYLKKEKFSIIMEKGAIVAYDDAIDVTDEIIKLYDSKP